MLIMESGKRHLTDGIELQNETRLECSEKKNPTNTWSCWRLTPLNKSRLKKKIKKNISVELESYSRQNSLAENLSN